MLKRKRGADTLSPRHLEKLQEDISRALKEAKGHERQRLSKRQRDKGATPEKKKKLQREILVLKSLDLHQTARAHLYSSLLKIKSVADHPDLPESLRRGIQKPDLAPEERLVLHNVTSGLCSRPVVRSAVDRAVSSACQALGVTPPSERKARRRDREGDGGGEERPVAPADNDGSDQETEFAGFSDNDDDDGNAGQLVAQELDSDAEAAVEAECDALDNLLGSSSSEEQDEDDDDKQRARLWEKCRAQETVNLDDISASEADPDVEEDDDDDDESDDDASKKVPPPANTKSTSTKNPQKPSPAAGSMFLPSLMHTGFISGSDYTSDSAADTAPQPPKKQQRRGQRNRRKIFEMKYGSRARHLQAAAAAGRDAGWDPRLGAVDTTAGAGGGGGAKRTPWKRDVRNPFSSSQDNKGHGGRDKGRGGTAGSWEGRQTPQTRTRRDDDKGPLHPSWEARKRAKDAQKATVFTGSKVVFD